MRGAFVGATGVTLPVHQAHYGGAESDLDLRVVGRPRLQPGLCGARWLRAHAERDHDSPLFDPKDGCCRGSEDGDGD